MREEVEPRHITYHSLQSSQTTRLLCAEATTKLTKPIHYALASPRSREVTVCTSTSADFYTRPSLCDCDNRNNIFSDISATAMATCIHSRRLGAA
jgi:hypothetical protein